MKTTEIQLLVNVLFNAVGKLPTAAIPLISAFRVLIPLHHIPNIKPNPRIVALYWWQMQASRHNPQLCYCQRSCGQNHHPNEYTERSVCDGLALSMLSALKRQKANIPQDCFLQLFYCFDDTIIMPIFHKLQSIFVTISYHQTYY